MERYMKEFFFFQTGLRKEQLNNENAKRKALNNILWNPFKILKPEDRGATVIFELSKKDRVRPGDPVMLGEMAFTKWQRPYERNGEILNPGRPNQFLMGIYHHKNGENILLKEYPNQ